MMADILFIVFLKRLNCTISTFHTSKWTLLWLINIKKYTRLSVLLTVLYRMNLSSSLSVLLLFSNICVLYIYIYILKKVFCGVTVAHYHAVWLLCVILGISHLFSILPFSFLLISSCTPVRSTMCCVSYFLRSNPPPFPPIFSVFECRCWMTVELNM